MGDKKVRISLRKEKEHCELLIAYADSSDSGLMDYREDLELEQQALVIDIGKKVFASSVLSDKHRIQLRRLRERYVMLNACQGVDPTEIARDNYEFYIGFARECLQVIDDLQANGETVAKLPDHLIRLI